ncbi:MAG: hypothetical protein A3F31_03940 [Candidatus Levybacteria bacterium RIFCSPHIGHO2_12_FULL_38_12]|nr:MAG: hypothetical protein A2770_02330 [Candidatus Levybacteria bacterium RIFCSPHIGHO2_01_FULL_38_12]OGH21916.1 MAG: hypothetical protein A3D75_00550 [Candidatus Levybacteria bacterium RIFCSPHIGHO2_02_FULL_37_18]OGH22848.1 MAG: hypothetical protein A3F31_03940 [Candidatus Levybacteria bacterium RIFCSPHIGHO2_12_FULL_38_12]OGH33573.1 MAG: hypothetical protein A3A47_01895 [Candidatus Levybacteria bacterium RIFCSPLOWO2_01_FULL_37_20]OGH44494.1 MAG: hypothetical protein A3J14_03585 [Candidatus Lev
MTETTPPKFFQLVTLKELNRKISLITDNRILDEVIDYIIANVPHKRNRPGMFDQHLRKECMFSTKVEIFLWKN